MIFKTEFPRARSPSCSVKLDSVQTRSIPRVWKISLSCQAVTVSLRTRNFELTCTSGGFVFSRTFSWTGQDSAWLPLVSGQFRFIRSTSLRRKQKKRFVEFETFGNSFRKVCNFQSVVSLRQIGTFSFNFSHQKQNVRKYWSPLALHCFFSDFFSGLPTAETVFFKNFGFQKGQKTTCYHITLSNLHDSPPTYISLTLLSRYHLINIHIRKNGPLKVHFLTSINKSRIITSVRGVFFSEEGIFSK